MAHKFDGSRYEATKSMSRVEVAKLVRQDVKTALAVGSLPKGLKVSVKVRSYAGGGSIDLRVAELPGMALCPVEAVGYISGGVEARPTPYAAAVLKKLDAMLQAYNFDDSDTQVDYFHVRFYGSAEFDWQLMQRAWAAYDAAGTPTKTFMRSEWDAEVERLSDAPESTEEVFQVALAVKALSGTVQTVSVPTTSTYLDCLQAAGLLA